MPSTGSKRPQKPVDISEFAKAIRLDCLRLTSISKASHIGSALSVTDILATIYSNPLRIEKIRQLDPNRDIIILSKGHAAVAQYSALKRVAVDSWSEFFDLDSFYQSGSLFIGHPNSQITGVEWSTGALGHGLPVAVGMALGKRLKGLTGEVVCICSDGELNEGSNWEALMLAAQLKLKNLLLIIDYNGIQSFGKVKDILDLEPISEKFQSFNFQTTVIDGHNFEELDVAINQNSYSGPRVIIANTIKGSGVSEMEDTLDWHYRSPSSDKLDSYIKEVSGSAGNFCKESN